MSGTSLATISGGAVLLGAWRWHQQRKKEEEEEEEEDLRLIKEEWGQDNEEDGGCGKIQARLRKGVARGVPGVQQAPLDDGTSATGGNFAGGEKARRRVLKVPFIDEDKEERGQQDNKEDGGDENIQARLGERIARGGTPGVQQAPVDDGASPTRGNVVRAKKARGIVLKVAFVDEDKDVLFGSGGLLDFFGEVYPGFFEVDLSSQAILYTNQSATGHTPESARACLEHAVRVCRDDGFKPRDFLLLRMSFEKVNRGAGSEGLAVRCPEFVAKVTAFMQNFGCVAHFVDLEILALANPSYQRAAGTCSSSGAARSMPDREFAPRFPIGANTKVSRVVNLFGLRHCVEAAKESLVRETLREEQRHVLRLGPMVVWCARNILGSSSYGGKVLFDVDEGELQVEGPQMRCQCKEMLSVLSTKLQFVKTVEVGDPVLMRTLGSTGVAQEILWEAWATDRVRVFASWPALCLVVCSNLGGDGSQDVNNVCHALESTVREWKQREVRVRIGNLSTVIRHSVNPRASTTAPPTATATATATDFSTAATAATAATATEERSHTWPCLLAEMSAVTGVALWLDGNSIRGRLPPPKPGVHAAAAVLVQTTVESMAEKLKLHPGNKNVEARKEAPGPPTTETTYVGSTLSRNCRPQHEPYQTGFAPPHPGARAAETLSAAAAAAAAAPMMPAPSTAAPTMMAAPPAVNVVHVHHHHVVVDHHHHHLAVSPPQSRPSFLDLPC